MRSNNNEWYEQHATYEPPLKLPPDIEKELESKRHPTLSEIEGLLQEHDYDLIIFGLRMKSDIKYIRVGNLTLYPHSNLKNYLNGYEENTVESILNAEAIFAKYRPSNPPRLHLFSPRIEDDCLIHFRLFKPGWISALRITPVVKVRGEEVGRGELGWAPQLNGQIWADPMIYDLDLDEISKIRKIYTDLISIPQGYLELALRKFSKSYDYYVYNKYLGVSELDDCLVDLVIALENLTSKSSDSVQQSIKLRSALLIGRNHQDMEQIEQQVAKFYSYRSKIVHGSHEDKGQISEKELDNRFMKLEKFRSFTRKIINASIAVLKEESQGSREPLSDSMAGVIDDYLLKKIQHK